MAQVSGEVAIVSDYRFRGVSLSEDHPALQGGVELDSGVGPYASEYVSVVPFGGRPGTTELTTTLGYRLEPAAGLTIDAFASHYHYPKTRDWDYFEANASLWWQAGARTALRAGLAYVPVQRHLRIDPAGSARNFYAMAGVDREVPGTPLTLTAEAGYEAGVMDGAARGGKLDWRLGSAVALGKFEVGLSYVGAIRPDAADGEVRHERALVLQLGRSF